MDAKEKAKDLVNTFYEPAAQMNFNLSKGWFIDEKQSRINAKRCATVCVKEILKSEETAYPNQYIEVGQVFKEFWTQVKTEIEKL